MEKFFLPQMRKYMYHIYGVIVLGKNFAAKERLRAIAASPGSLGSMKDYADAIQATCNREIQSDHFGDQTTTSMEGAYCQFVDPAKQEEGIRTEFNCYVSDDKQQDSRTSFANTVFLIKQAREKGLIPPEGEQTLYECMDGCGKQYRCANSIYLMSVVSNLYKISCNRMTSPPGHGKSQVDAANGRGKSKFVETLRTVQFYGINSDDPTCKWLCPCLVDLQGKKISFADLVVKILSRPEYRFGVKGEEGKSQKRENNNRVIKEHHYIAVHHGELDEEANCYLPIMNTRMAATGFDVPPKFVGKPKLGEKIRQGINDHYQTHTCWELGIGKGASRRIACYCESCETTIHLPWDNSVDPATPSLQPRFQRPPDCILAPSVQEFNDYKIVSVFQTEDVLEEEVMQICEDVLANEELNASNRMKDGNFAAYRTTEGFDIFKIVGEPYPLECDGDEVEGCPEMPAGTVVCKGIHWNKARGRAPGWCTPPPARRAKKYVFRVRYVVDPDLKMLDSKEVEFPKGRKDRDKILKMKPRKLAQENRDFLMHELSRRAALDYEEGTLEETESKQIQAAGYPAALASTRKV